MMKVIKNAVTYCMGMECGFLSFPWETTRLLAARASERTAIGLAMIISAKSLWNLSLNRLKSPKGGKTRNLWRY